MNLQSLKTRLNRLLADQEPPDGPPACLVFLPGKDGHDPAADEDLPRIAWRNRCAACIVYDPAHGQPSAETIRQLVDEATP